MKKNQQEFSRDQDLSEAEEANLEMQKPFKGETDQTPKQGVSPAFIFNPVINEKTE